MCVQCFHFIDNYFIVQYDSNKPFSDFLNRWSFGILIYEMVTLGEFPEQNPPTSSFFVKIKASSLEMGLKFGHIRHFCCTF